MEIGIDGFAALLPDLETGRTSTGSERMALLLAEIETADRGGLDVFGIGEHHRELQWQQALLPPPPPPPKQEYRPPVDPRTRRTAADIEDEIAYFQHMADVDEAVRPATARVIDLLRQDLANFGTVRGETP